MPVYRLVLVGSSTTVTPSAHHAYMHPTRPLGQLGHLMTVHSRKGQFSKRQSLLQKQAQRPNSSGSATSAGTKQTTSLRRRVAAKERAAQVR